MSHAEDLPANAGAPSWSEFFVDNPRDKLRVFDWSVSGFETCIVVHGQGFRLALDIGACPHQAISADVVFVSHGHVDHCGAIHQHMRRRQLFGLPPAVYYVPEHLVEPLSNIVRLFGTVHGDDANDAELEEESSATAGSKNKTNNKKSAKPDAEVKADFFYGKILPAKPGEDIELSKNLRILPFATDHRVPSIGCLLYSRRSQLLPQFANLPGPELAELARNGQQLRESHWEATLGYTGDTRFSVLACPTVPDLLKVKLLICELTYVDGLTDLAEKYGHCHLHDFSSRPGLFDKVGQLFFVHFSRRHHPERVLKSVLESLPDDLKRRVYCGLNALRFYH